jgi:hypothetical protein
VTPACSRATLTRVKIAAGRALGTRLLSLSVVLALAVVVGPGCSLGEGGGSAIGTIDIPQCWSGAFNLNPDFFAAVPSASSDALQIRIQNGGDYESFSDGIAITVDDAGQVRGDPLPPDNTPRPSLLGQALSVSLPRGVTPPGVPIKPNASPSIVHAELYLQHTCRTQNVALYAMDAVTLNPDGSCSRADGGDPAPACGAATAAAPDGGTAAGPAPADASAADAGPASTTLPAQTGGSTIVFNSLFDGNPDESDAQQRLTDAHFEFYLADPREICPGGLGPPPRCRGHLTGSFKFYFERGRPAQPFP